MMDVEILWDKILSRVPEQVRQAYHTLAKSEKETVRTHLRKMIAESDWHPEQKISAKEALAIIAMLEGKKRKGPEKGREK